MIGRNKDRHLKYKETDRMDQSGLVVTFSNLLKSFKIGRMLEIFFSALVPHCDQKVFSKMWSNVYRKVAKGWFSDHRMDLRLATKLLKQLLWLTP